MPDIFISYAHIDNEPFGEERSRWVTEFAENLRKRLGMVAGEAAELWRDPRLQGNDAIWPTIEGALAEALALVSVISPRYVKSDSCLREIESSCRSGGSEASAARADASRCSRSSRHMCPAISIRTSCATSTGTSSTRRTRPRTGTGSSACTPTRR